MAQGIALEGPSPPRPAPPRAALRFLSFFRQQRQRHHETARAIQTAAAPMVNEAAAGVFGRARVWPRPRSLDYVRHTLRQSRLRILCKYTEELGKSTMWESRICGGEGRRHSLTSRASCASSRLPCRIFVALRHAARQGLAAQGRGGRRRPGRACAHARRVRMQTPAPLRFACTHA